MPTTTEPDKANMDGLPLYTYPNGLTGQAPVRCLNDRPSYQSPAQIQAWAASATGDLADSQTLEVQNSDSFPSDGSWSGLAPPMPGYLKHSNSSDGSDAWNEVPMQHSLGLMFNDRAPAVANAHGVQSANGTGLAMPQELEYTLPRNTDGDYFTMDSEYILDHQPYPSPVEDDMSFALSNNEQSRTHRDAHVALDPCHGWSAPVPTQEMHTSLVNGVCTSGWANANVDPSVSSSQSSHRPDTPLSLTQDQWEDATFELHPPHMDGSKYLVPPHFSDPQSTVKLSSGPQRSPLPEQWIQSQLELAGQAYGSPISTFPSSRRSSEGEPLSARRDPLYLEKPRADGLYQCIYVDDDDKQCDHEPFKLKCNYDKHLDSHLKPYRCKQSGCAENPFSSTACLLRHEREAHGMHNHKEVLCAITDCERSFPGKGFPRKWNAHDHMKRVHRCTPPEDSNSGEASPPSASPVDIPHGVGSGVRTGRRQLPSPTESTGPRKTKATSGRSTKRAGRAQSSQQNSQRQMLTEHNVLMDGIYTEVLNTGTHWTQWPQYQTIQGQGQQILPMETL